jgi:stringent starvation protein B
MPAALPSKKEVLLGLLEKASVLVHLDARREDVKVPRHLKTNPQLILQLGLNLAVPIPDLEVGDERVSCTLSFARTPFYCVLPYAAIFAMVAEDGGRAMVWPEDVPAEVAKAAETEARKLGLIKPNEVKGPPLPRIEIGPRPSSREEMPNKRLRDNGKGSTLDAKRAPKPKVVSGQGTPQKPRPTRERSKKELPPYLRVIK